MTTDLTTGLDTSACADYLAEVRAFADSINKRPQLEEQLTHLGTLRWFGGPATCLLYKDFAPHSFAFCLVAASKVVMQGGLLFYAGAESGVGGPQLSVVTSGRTDARWEVHT